jgi:N-acetyltransferase 10
MMSDAPAHHLFCLLGPVDSSRNTLPEILVVLQVNIRLFHKNTISFA